MRVGVGVWMDGDAGMCCEHGCLEMPHMHALQTDYRYEFLLRSQFIKSTLFFKCELNAEYWNLES